MTRGSALSAAFWLNRELQRAESFALANLLANTGKNPCK
jgi:hypothetical protein